MRIAHLSDLHVAAAVELGRIFNKRLTGWANLVLRRGRVHQSALLERVLAGVARSGADHVVISGDLTNLALEAEFEMAREFIENHLGYSEDRVSIVPGNHDVYTRGSWRAGRFGRYFADYISSDLPELGVDLPLGRFPFVRLRGPAAILGLSSAVPRPPFVAAGRLGGQQVEALRRALAHPEVASRSAIILLHHSPFQRASALRQIQEGLEDVSDLHAALSSVKRGAILFGHFHARLRRPFGPSLEAFEATSASLDHADPDRRAGFNLYELDAQGRLTAAEGRIETGGAELAARAIPSDEHCEIPR